MQRRLFSTARRLQGHENPLVCILRNPKPRNFLIAKGIAKIWHTSEPGSAHEARPAGETTNPRCKESYCCIFSKGWCWQIYNFRYRGLVRASNMTSRLLISVNLALAFARSGLQSGILDTDIFGPSIPTLLNLEGEEPRLSSSMHPVNQKRLHQSLS